MKSRHDHKNHVKGILFEKMAVKLGIKLTLYMNKKDEL
jgi:hypothetical protein